MSWLALLRPDQEMSISTDVFFNAFLVVACNSNWLPRCHDLPHFILKPDVEQVLRECQQF